MKSKNTIELNGNVYDALTGKILSAAKPAEPVQVHRATPVNVTAVKPAAPVKHVVHRSSTTNIDGFFRSRTMPSTAPSAQKVAVSVKSAATPQLAKPARVSTPNHARAHQPQASKRVTAVKPAAPTIQVINSTKSSTSVNHTKAHKQQASKTLMRSVVKQPNPSLKRQTNVQSALTHQVPGLVEIKRPASAINTDRLVRATSTEVSPLIAHHGKEVPKVSPFVAPLEVKPVPVKPEGEVPVQAPAPQPTNKPQDIFDHALANAKNFRDVKEHRGHFRKQARTHVTSMAAGTLALFVITGFAAYQNSPGLQLKVASVQAGFSTNMPNFEAAGFAYNGAHADNGRLTVGFTDKAGKYQLTQQNTNSSGKDMIQDISSTDASGRPNYTTVNANGTTVYRFNNTGAVWISEGKWYSVSGNSALTDSQIKSIVENV